MGTQAIDSEETEDVVITDPDDQAPAIEPEDTDPDTEGEEPAGEDVQVVLDDGDSPPKKAAENFGVRKRIRQLNKKHESAISDSNAALQLEKDKNIVLQARVDQMTTAKPAVVAPKPEDFEDGIYDPRYKQAHEEYTEARIDTLVDKKVTDRTKQSAQTVNHQALARDLEEAQVKHYGRATELGVKDYEAKEDEAIKVLGEDNVNAIIKNFKKSHVVLYYLGTNPGKAEEIAELAATNPVQAAAEIGRLEERLKVKSKTNPASNPDEELEGGTPTAKGHIEAMHKKLVKRACSGAQKDMNKLAKFRKEMRAKGVKLG